MTQTMTTIRFVHIDLITRPHIFHKILTCKKKETKRMVDIVALMGYATKLRHRTVNVTVFVSDSFDLF